MVEGLSSMRTCLRGALAASSSMWCFVVLLAVIGLSCEVDVLARLSSSGGISPIVVSRFVAVLHGSSCGNGCGGFDGVGGVSSRRGEVERGAAGVFGKVAAGISGRMCDPVDGVDLCRGLSPSSSGL